MAKNLHIEQRAPRILIIGLMTPEQIAKGSESYMEEFRSLISSNKITPTIEYITKLRSISPSTFVTKGKLEDIQKICITNNIEEIIFSEILTPHQEHMLSKFLKANVFDRTHLILEIFEKGANSGEGKLQVEIAFLEHKKTRVSGKGIELEQQAGRIGGKGPGETLKEVELQHIDHLLVRLKKELKQLEQVRHTQRKQRLKSFFPKLALIGYTNAGKSTILNALTNSNVLAEDKLFATLDTTTRELFIKGEKVGLLSDTVGFIQNLPHKLINAFKSTLDELHYADLLLHVIDISNKDWKNHIDVVNNLLKELELEAKPILHVFNKIDKLAPEIIESLHIFNYSPNVFINASNQENGLYNLKEYINKHFNTIENNN